MLGPPEVKLSPIVMEVENGYILLLEGPMFDFHDYGRKCKLLVN